MQLHTQIWALAQQHGFYKVLVAGRLTDDLCVVRTVLALSTAVKGASRWRRGKPPSTVMSITSP